MSNRRNGYFVRRERQPRHGRAMNRTIRRHQKRLRMTATIRGLPRFFGMSSLPVTILGPLGVPR